MLKLIKYEFRKARTAMLVMLCVLAALEGYFLGALALEKNDHVAVAIMLLMVGVYAAAIFVFVRGLTSYTSELKNRNAYLIFMTPNSGLKIMGSKYLYTFVNGLLVGAVCAALAAVDITLFFRANGEIDTLLSFLRRMLANYGVYLDQMVLYVLIMALYGMLSMLAFFAVAYLAITLSHTLFRDKKWRGFVSFVLFVAMNYGISRLVGLFPSPTEQLLLIDLNPDAANAERTVTTLGQLLPLLVPSACMDLVCVVASLFGCGWMLDQKVSL